MAAITSLTGLLIATSSVLVCTPLDLLNSDRLEVDEAAQTFLHERGIDESSAERQYQKCGYRIPDNPPAKRAEQVNLIALFEEQSDQAGESTRDRVDCYVNRFWVDGSLQQKKSSCESTTQRLLTHTEVSEPIRLFGEISFDDARAVLRFLSDRIGGAVGRQRFGEEDFSNIFHMQAHPSHIGTNTYSVISGSDAAHQMWIHLRSDSAGSFEVL